IQPSSRSRCTKPAIHWPWVEGVPPPMTPIIGSFDGCCARAASGHAAATPPSSVMNSSLQDGAESAMSIRIGYLLPTRERIMAGQLPAAPLLELAERAERVSVPPRYPAAPAYPSAVRRVAAAKSRLSVAASYRRKRQGDRGTRRRRHGPDHRA